MLSLFAFNLPRWELLRVTRTSILTVLIVVGSFLLSLRVSAQTTGSTPPQLTVVSRTSPSSVSPEANVSFDYTTIAGTSALTFVQIHFTGPDGVGRDAAAVTNTLTGMVSKAVKSDWLNGVYAVNYVVLNDSNGRIIFYKRDDSIVISGGSADGPTTHSLNIANLDFQLTGAAREVMLSQLVAISRTSTASRTGASSRLLVLRAMFIGETEDRLLDVPCLRGANDGKHFRYLVG